MSLTGKSWADIEKSVAPIVINPHFLQKQPLNTEIFNFLQIPKEYRNDVRIFDTILSEDGTQFLLVHYIVSPPPVEIADLRGVIIKRSPKGEYSIICKSFPYTEERILSESSIPDFYFERSSTKIMKAYEGTIFRVWWYNDEWYMSTHRKINAKKSKWGGPLFGEMFNEIIPFEVLDNTLNREICYVFLLCHPKNRLVVSYQEPYLYHVGEYYAADNRFYLPKTKINYPNVRYVEEIKINKWKDLAEEVSKLDWHNESGILVHLKPNTVIKIINEQYKDMRDLRGNEPNLRIRWFQLLSENKEKELEKLLPEKKEFFDLLKEDNIKVVEWLNELYKNHFKKKTHRFPKEVFWILQAYKDAEEKIPMDKIVEKYNARVKNALIREMHRYEKMPERNRDRVTREVHFID